MATASTFRFSGKRWREARVERGWSIAENARALRTSETNVGRWERGDNEPSGSMVAAQAQATGHEIEFFYVEGEPDDEEEEAALRREARNLLSTLNDSMVDALIAELRARTRV